MNESDRTLIRKTIDIVGVENIFRYLIETFDNLPFDEYDDNDMWKVRLADSLEDAYHTYLTNVVFKQEETAEQSDD